MRVLRLESRLGCEDAAVIGGLDKFIANAGRSVQRLRPPNGWLYSALNKEARCLWIEAAVKLLEKDASRLKITSDSSSMRLRWTDTESSRPTPVEKPRKPSKSKYRIDLDAPIGDLRYFPKRFAKQFQRIGIGTVKDMLWKTPARYEDYSRVIPISHITPMAMQPPYSATVRGKIESAWNSGAGRHGKSAKALVKDDSGSAIEITWFGQPYLLKKLKPGNSIAVSGDVSFIGSLPRMTNPEYEIISSMDALLTHAGRLLPVYPLTEGLYQRTIRNVSRRSLDATVPDIEDWLPEHIRADGHFFTLQDALENLHYPTSPDSAVKARRRLAFDELLLIQMSVIRQRQEWRDKRASEPIVEGRRAAETFSESLGFTLTKDQEKSLCQILDDMQNPYPMARLLQGEVGSGKTVVALAAMLAVIKQGRISAMLAPTEVLAEQHFLSACEQLSASDIGIVDTLKEAEPPGLGHKMRIGLLTGGLSMQNKRWMAQAIAAGDVHAIIGTHALLQESVSIPDLSLLVVDEQHRFGVEQRSALADRDPRPHVLAMSATPIPRTLQMTVYGDMEVSTLRAMPYGRRPVVTKRARTEEDRTDAYRILKEEASKGRQAFIVCPLIEDSETITARSVLSEYKRLHSSDALREVTLGLLHGRMKLQEKNRVMEKFRAGKIQALVATSVIEVGVDVPNATVMIIESAERFGLAQLHQLRGRVGRGGESSWCIAITDDPEQESNARLNAFAESDDGFELAEKDLRLRGAGRVYRNQTIGMAGYQDS